MTLLEMTQMQKSYGAVRALRDGSLRISRPGVVHALMGQNGCGKSTTLGILSGQLRADAGSIELEGKPLQLRDPAQAVRQGIAMVSQETALAEDLSITENILMGRLQRGPGGVKWPASHARATAVLRQLGLDYDPTVPVRALRPDQRQLVEIARAISTKARILILDEPTSSLTDDQVQHLFRTIRSLTARGVSVLFVSHRLPEVFEISDEITVMRDGRTVSTGPVEEYTPESLVADMVGDSGVDAPLAAGSSAGVASTSEPVFTVSGLTCEPAFRGVSFSVRPGQVIGLAGLSGSGCSEVLAALFGAGELDDGTIELAGEPFRASGPREAIDAGIGYVPPDRKTLGLLLEMSSSDNIATAASHRRPRWHRIGRTAELAAARATASRVGLDPAVLDRPARGLSGGNQQKVLLAKWLATEPRVLLLDEPTRGVDVGAKAEIHRRLREVADDGLALVVTSSDIPELIGLCEEIMVLFRGRIVARLHGGDISEAAISAAAGGHA